MTARAEAVRRIIHDPAEWGPFCHGTSTRFLSRISRKGLTPRECEGGRCRPSVYTGELESHKDKVYLGRAEMAIGTCIDASRKAANKFGGRQVVLGTCLTKSDIPRLVEDEDLYGLEWMARDNCREVFRLVNKGATNLRSYAASERLPPRALQMIARHTDWTDEERNRVCDMENWESWALSLAARLTVAHRGTLPSTHIVASEATESLYYPGGREKVEGWRGRCALR